MQLEHCDYAVGAFDCLGFVHSVSGAFRQWGITIIIYTGCNWTLIRWTLVQTTVVLVVVDLVV